jgi:serine acetyltransferase
MTARAALRVDLERYLPGAPPWAVPVRLRAAITHPQMWILALFRFGVYLRSEAPPMVALLMTPLWRVASAVLHTVFDIHIGAAAQIGPGLYISCRITEDPTITAVVWKRSQTLSSVSTRS